MTTTHQLQAATRVAPVIPAQRGTTPAPHPFAAELHPAWCDGLGVDHPNGCGVHDSAPEYLPLISNGFDNWDGGAVYPMLTVLGSVDSDDRALAVTVILYAFDTRRTTPAELVFTAAEALRLADLLTRVESGSVAATGGKRVSAVRVEVFGGGSFSLTGGLKVRLDVGEANLFAGVLRRFAALPVDAGVFGTWAEHRERGIGQS